VGILLYEMLCGVTPFRQKDKAKLRRMITCDKLKFTKNADGVLRCPHSIHELYLTSLITSWPCLAGRCPVRIRVHCYQGPLDRLHLIFQTTAVASGAIALPVHRLQMPASGHMHLLAEALPEQAQANVRRLWSTKCDAIAVGQHCKQPWLRPSVTLACIPRRLPVGRGQVAGQGAAGEGCGAAPGVRRHRRRRREGAPLLPQDQLAGAHRPPGGRSYKVAGSVASMQQLICFVDVRSSVHRLWVCG
jgi:hypothetical protein